jgi:ADP-ribose pyrophosphatase YjhB (NUDIX family)
MDIYLFQNCQKIVVFSKNGESVLLAKRKGEADYDEMYSFIGGKMETTDRDILDGLRREKNEEVGEQFKINIYPVFNITKYFIKKDGNAMVLPHYYAQHIEGEVNLSQEYSEIKWILLSDLEQFEPKIENITEIVQKFIDIKKIFQKEDFVMI